MKDSLAELFYILVNEQTLRTFILYVSYLIQIPIFAQFISFSFVVFKFQ